MANYHDPFYSGQKADQDRRLDPYNTHYSRGSGVGTLIALLFFAGLLGAIFVVFGGVPEDRAPGTTTAPPVTEPAAPGAIAPDATAPVPVAPDATAPAVPSQ